MAGISTTTRVSPAPAEPGLLSRLLRRGRSNNQHERSLASRKPAKDSHILISSKSSQRDQEQQQVRPKTSPNGPGQRCKCDACATHGTSSIPTHQVESSHKKTNQTFPEAAVHTEQRHHQQQWQPQPQANPAMPPPLKKKPSLMDRFRFRSNDETTAGQQTEPQRKPPPAAVYVPKHAASDFSRMPVSPRNRDSFLPIGHGTSNSHNLPVRQKLAPILSSDDPNENDERAGTDWGDHNRHHARPHRRQTRPESRGTSAQGSEATPQRLDRPDDCRDRLVAVSEKNAASRSASARPHPPQPAQSHRHSYTLRADRHNYDPPPSPYHQLSLPQVSTAPFSHHLASFSEKLIPSVPVASADDRSKIHDQDDLHGRVSGGDQSSSDYQVFLQRAAEEDRALREQFWRKLTNDGRGYASNNPSPRRPSHHLDDIEEYQTNYSTGTTAVNPRSSHRSGSKRASSQFFGGYSSSQQQQPQGSSDRYKRSSWAVRTASDNGWRDSSDGTAEEEEKLASRRLSAISAVGAHEQHHVSSGDVTTQTQPRTLRRQSSVTQRISEYIKPPRDSTIYDEPGSRLQSWAHRVT